MGFTKRYSLTDGIVKLFFGFDVAAKNRFPRLYKAVYRTLYNFMAWRFPDPDWVFMNYGFAEEDSVEVCQLQLLSEDESNRYFIQLYEHTLGGIDLKGADVLEVGSGRGGGASWIARSQGVRSMTGLDLSEQAAAYCNKRHQLPNLRFEQGDAEDLPFQDGSFDAVVNIESCQLYPSMEAFLQEVFRVLKPGGHFCLAVVLYTKEASSFIERIQQFRFEVLNKRDITSNIIAALDADESRKVGLIDRLVPRMLRRAFKTFAAVSGTETYRDLVDGRSTYLSYLLRRPLVSSDLGSS